MGPASIRVSILSERLAYIQHHLLHGKLPNSRAIAQRYSAIRNGHLLSLRTLQFFMTSRPIRRLAEHVDVSLPHARQFDIVPAFDQQTR